MKLVLFAALLVSMNLSANENVHKHYTHGDHQKYFVTEYSESNDSSTTAAGNNISIVINGDNVVFDGNFDQTNSADVTATTN